MGNRVVENFKKESTWLGKGGRGPHWTKLDYFYTNELTGDKK